VEFQYDDGGRKAAGYKGEEVGDCVARAVAIAAQLPYYEVYGVLAYGNKTERRTRGKKAKGKYTAQNGIHVKRIWFKGYMEYLGFTWVPTMFIGQGCRVHLKADELPSGRLVVAVSKHYTTVIDGVIHDTYNPDRDGTRCVYGYWIHDPHLNTDGAPL
jgi:hypothetical protein